MARGPGHGHLVATILVWRVLVWLERPACPRPPPSLRGPLPSPLSRASCCPCPLLSARPASYFTEKRESTRSSPTALCPHTHFHSHLPLSLSASQPLNLSAPLGGNHILSPVQTRLRVAVNTTLQRPADRSLPPSCAFSLPPTTPLGHKQASDIEGCPSPGALGSSSRLLFHLSCGTAFSQAPIRLCSPVFGPRQPASCRRSSPGHPRSAPSSPSPSPLRLKFVLCFVALGSDGRVSPRLLFVLFLI